MEKYYFYLSLDLLINKLKQYESKNKIIEFIKKFDLLLKNDITFIDNPTEQQVKYFQEIINDICDFLFTCLERKVSRAKRNLDNREFLNEIYNTKFTITARYKEFDTENIHNIEIFDKERVLKLKQSIKELKNKVK